MQQIYSFNAVFLTPEPRRPRWRKDTKNRPPPAPGNTVDGSLCFHGLMRSGRLTNPPRIVHNAFFVLEQQADKYRVPPPRNPDGIMLRFLPSFRATRNGFLRRPIRIPLPPARVVIPGLSILGLAVLTFMAGTAVMFFRLPPSGFFETAFAGARAWYARGQSTADTSLYATQKAKAGVRKYETAKTFDGLTLYTTTEGSRARLIDMHGKLVHQWQLPFSKAFPRTPHIARTPLPDKAVHWFRCYMYPNNGDLLALYHADGDTPYGYGLAKLDKDSRLLWSYAANTHHDVDVGEDGRIYTLTQHIIPKPPPGLGSIAGPLIVDSLVILSPEGRELESIPLVEAFRDSPYASVLMTSLDVPTARDIPPQEIVKGDILHTNSVRVLTRSLAPRFPQFKQGQVLLSLRRPNAIAVLDTHTRKVVWAARGVWMGQHQAQFLRNGHILLYDNIGSAHGTRLIEYDPATQAMPWVYANENSAPFKAGWRGMQQRLPNGNTLIVNPEYWSILEVTPGKELVWECCCEGTVTSAWRYRANDLKFLKGGIRARP
jgi:hypothetical protein